MSFASAVRLILLGAIWGSSFLFIKIAVPAFGPAMLIEVRLALAAALLACVAAATGRTLNWRENWRHHVIIGGVNSAIPFLSFAYAALFLPASLLALFNSLAPIFGAVVSAIWLRTPVTAQTVIGLLSGVAGVGVLSADRILGASISASPAEIAGGLAAATFAPFCYGFAGVYIKRASTTIDPYANAHGAMWSAAVLSLPLALLLAPETQPAVPAVAAAMILGLVCTGAAYLLQFKLFADLGATRGLSVAFLIPVFGVLWGVVFLHEPIGWTLAAGGGLILLGTGLVTGMLTVRRAAATTGD
jgi:drug/metabolite transporter (DMT)-like permease